MSDETNYQKQISTLQQVMGTLAMQIQNVMNKEIQNYFDIEYKGKTPTIDEIQKYGHKIQQGDLTLYKWKGRDIVMFKVETKLKEQLPYKCEVSVKRVYIDGGRTPIVYNLIRSDGNDPDRVQTNSENKAGSMSKSSDPKG